MGLSAADDNKVRLRSDGELAEQEAGLVRLCEVLDSAAVPWLLSGGTLLGAARDGDFIRWDWDVEVSVRSEDVESRLDELVARLRTSDFVLQKRDDDPNNLKLVVQYGKAEYEIRAHRRRGQQRLRKDFVLLDRFFQEAETVTLRGRQYPCMGPLDEYLTHCYGDWRTPKRTAKKSDYLSSSHFRGTTLRRQLRNRLCNFGRTISRKLRPWVA